jgi:uncharacterized protein YpmS
MGAENKYHVVVLLLLLLLLLLYDAAKIFENHRPPTKVETSSERKLRGSKITSTLIEYEILIWSS